MDDEWQHCKDRESAKVGAQMTYFMRKAQSGSFHAHHVASG